MTQRGHDGSWASHSTGVPNARGAMLVAERVLDELAESAK
jgi:hypothetical protein